MALRDQPYLPLFVKDFLTDEKLADCSAATNGVYIRLMCIMHKSEEYGTFLLRQNSKQNIFSILDFASRLEKQMPYKEEEIAAALDELIFYGVIRQEGPKILQKRMVRDNSLSEIRAKAGKKGGETTGICLSKMASKTQANTESAIVNTNEDESIETIGGLEERFNKFWNAYPRQIARFKAEREFSIINPSAAVFQLIMDSLEKWKKCDQWKEDNGKFIPYPEKWIKDGMWESKVPEPNTKKKADGNTQNFEGVTYSDEFLRSLEVDPEELMKKWADKKARKQGNV